MQSIDHPSKEGTGPVQGSRLSGHKIHGDGAERPVESAEASQPSSIKGEKIEKNSVEADVGVTEEQDVYPGAFALVFIIIALVLAMFLVALDMTIVATVIPQITDEFKSLDQVGWYGSAFFLTLASFQSTWGKGYKYFPLKTTFLLSIFVFEIGSLMCAVAQNSTTLIVGRDIAGAGAAGISSGVCTRLLPSLHLHNSCLHTLGLWVQHMHAPVLLVPCLVESSLAMSPGDGGECPRLTYYADVVRFVSLQGFVVSTLIFLLEESALPSSSFSSPHLPQHTQRRPV